ncbi:MAG: hypothetical protein KAU20_02765 [Nanoarchaeota archaeon]|nr:hypothetical protein [Nanoarchaeota archaeon]
MAKRGYKPSKVEKIERTIKKDIEKVGDGVDKELEKVENLVKKELKKPSTIDFFITYGWAILVIIIGISAFFWWQFFDIDRESCEFTEGSGLLCEDFDVTNESVRLAIRNLNNKTVKIEEIKINSCFINPNIDMGVDSKNVFTIGCNLSSGRFRKKAVITYTIDDFQKHAVAKLAKVVP